MRSMSRRPATSHALVLTVRTVALAKVHEVTAANTSTPRLDSLLAEVNRVLPVRARIRFLNWVAATDRQRRVTRPGGQR